MLVPESCMKIIEKFEWYLITIGCDNLESIEKYSIGKNDNGGFYLINFHPSGEPEASMTLWAALSAPFVTKGSK